MHVINFQFQIYEGKFQLPFFFWLRSIQPFYSFPETAQPNTEKNI